MSTGSPPIAGSAVESDGELARRVAAGDRAAAATLIERYERLVRSFLRKVTGKPDVADDLAQETFVRLLQHADRYDEQYPMRTWLLTIARRLSINFGRRMDQQVMSTEYEGHRAAANDPADLAAAADTRELTRRRLDVALGQLSTAQREVMLLFHQQELSIEDVAQVMEIPVGTVKSHLHRARAALRKILAPQYEVIES